MLFPRRLPAAAGAILLLVLAGTASGSSSASAPPVSHSTLANGLEVVIIPDRRAPVVTHMVWYRVGAADEPPGKSGIAHFLEHLMFKGTAKNPAGRFSQVVATIGGQENAFTSHDYTAYFQRVSREHLPTLMEFEADRMTGLVLTDENVLPERNVVLEEQNSRVANEPSARLGEQVSAALYVNHPYGRPIIGWRHEIEKLNRDDALAFYRRFYTPNNAVLVIAGDISVEDAKSLVERTYGKVKRRFEVTPRMRPQEPEPNAARQVVLSDPRVAQPSLQRSYLVPSYATARPGESEAVDVLAYLVGNGATGRLFQRLVVEQGIATSAGGWYQGMSLDASRMGLHASPKPDVTLTALERAMDGVVAEVIEKGFSAEEVELAKSRMIADYIYAQDNQSTLARLYGSALTTGLSVDDVRLRPERLRAVTAEAVREAARTYLLAHRSVTGYLVKDGMGREEKRS